MAGSIPGVQSQIVEQSDPRLGVLFDQLADEYSRRYGHPRQEVHQELLEYPSEEFSAPDGAFVVFLESGRLVAGGAFRRYEEQTAELKRIWTHSAHRGRGLARLVLAELESVALLRGYQRIYLTTGPRQPEARGLYLAAGYLPQFDVSADPESIGHLAFRKELSHERHLAPTFL